MHHHTRRNHFSLARLKAETVKHWPIAQESAADGDSRQPTAKQKQLVRSLANVDREAPVSRVR